MENILRDVNAVVGVTGSFVCDDGGSILAKQLPNVYDEAMLLPVGRTMAQTIAGLRVAHGRQIGDIDLLYAQGRLIIKSVEGGCLCILCVRRVNVPLLNLTANVAAQKLGTEIDKRQVATVRPASQTAKTEPETPEDAAKRKMTIAEAMAANIRR